MDVYLLFTTWTCPIDYCISDHVLSDHHYFIILSGYRSTLLASLPAEEFRPHIIQLRKTLEWIEIHQSIEIIPDYCDVESGQCYGKALRG